jgi:hypothetical protein
MDWIYNSRTGTVMQVPSPIALAELKSGLGWHGPFKSKEKALAFYTANKSKNPGWKEPTGYLASLGNVPGAAVDTVGSAIVDKAGFSSENINAWLIRIGEILLGIVLIGVGIAKLTGNSNTVSKLVKAQVKNNG